MLLGKDGIELMHDIFKFADVRLIFMSVYGQDETVARVLVALRKRVESLPGEPSGPHAVGELSIGFALRQVAVDGEVTAPEYAALLQLV